MGGAGGGGGGGGGDGKIRNGKLPKMLGTGELGLWAFVMLLWCKMEVAGLSIYILSVDSVIPQSEDRT